LEFVGLLFVLGLLITLGATPIIALFVFFGIMSIIMSVNDHISQLKPVCGVILVVISLILLLTI